MTAHVCHPSYHEYTDIKPANILLDVEGNAKLGDLNVSKCVDDGGAVQVRFFAFLSPSVVCA